MFIGNASDPIFSTNIVSGFFPKRKCIVIYETCNVYEIIPNTIHCFETEDILFNLAGRCVAGVCIIWVILDNSPSYNVCATCVNECD